MRRLVIFLQCFIALFCFCGASGHAQTVKGKVVGNDNTPLAYADVLLYASNDTLNLYRGVSTDSLGLFTVDNVSIGKYRIQFRSLGYNLLTKYINVDSLGCSIPTVKLQESDIRLGEVQVNANQ